MFQGQRSKPSPCQLAGLRVMDFSSVSKSCDFNAVVEPTYWRETPRLAINPIAQKDWLSLAWPVVNAM